MALEPLVQPKQPEAMSSPEKVLAAKTKKVLARDGFLLDVDFSIPAGITILFGASGAGKTTLLDCIAGLVTPDSGRVAVSDVVLFDSSAHIDLPARHREAGYVFQELALFPHLSVRKNVEYGLHGHSSAKKRKPVDAILESFRIAHLRDRRPAEISGGERQRVALARSLVTDPRLLLLDEPLAGLDAPTKSKIVDDLREWNRTHAIPILYVTHNREEVFALGERVLVIEDGRLIAQGTPHEVMLAPRLEAVARLSGVENIFDVSVTTFHEDRGTMTCQIVGSQVSLETPLVRAQAGSKMRIGIHAGDVLLATSRPVGISAQNIIPARLSSVTQRDVMTIAVADCGVSFEIHLTLAARDALHLGAGKEVWLIIKTYSCHPMRD